MTQHRARPDFDFIAGAVLFEALAASDGAPPEWVQVTPRGRHQVRDARQFDFDPEALAARFSADGIDIPVDIDHAVSKRAMFGERADAVGWVKELAARPDGLHARIEWLAAGRDALAARTHRYISPTLRTDELGRTTLLHSIALVAAPALAMPAVASFTHEETHMKSVIQALGLSDGADEAACLSAIAALKAGAVPKGVHDEALANLAATTEKLASAQQQLDALAATSRKEKVDALIEAALGAKKIVPAQRDTYAALAATDAGLEQVKALLDKTPAGLAAQASGLDGREAPGGDLTSDPVALAAAAGVYQKKLADGGQTIGFADAVMAVKEGKK